MKHKTLFTTEKFKNYCYIEEKMMLGTNHGWEPDGDGGKGDALWRTGWAYITYGEKILKEGILNCFTDEIDKKGKKYIQGHRFPGQGEDNFSRDQLISGLAALYVNGDYDEVKRIRKGLKWRISKKFRLTPGLWFWMMSISTKQPFSFLYSVLFCITHFIITVPIMILWNKILYKWADMTEISQEEQNTRLHTEGMKVVNTKDFKRPNIVNTIHYPAYAFHLFAWQLHTLSWNPLKRLLKIASRPGVHKSNYLMRMLFGEKVSIEDIKAFRPMSGIRWQGRFFKGKEDNICYYSACEIIEENYHFNVRLGLTSDYNALDNDMLWYLVEKYPKLITD